MQFAIKVMKENGEIVGHLSRELSRCKYYLDRRASMHCELISTRYRRPPLVQGGLIVACRVTIKTPVTMLHQKLSERY